MMSIVTINVRGLRDPQKRREVFVYFKKIKYDVILLQEMHSCENDEVIWSSEWGS